MDDFLQFLWDNADVRFFVEVQASPASILAYTPSLFHATVHQAMGHGWLPGYMYLFLLLVDNKVCCHPSRGLSCSAAQEYRRQTERRANIRSVRSKEQSTQQRQARRRCCPKPSLSVENKPCTNMAAAFGGVIVVNPRHWCIHWHCPGCETTIQLQERRTKHSPGPLTAASRIDRPQFVVDRLVRDVIVLLRDRAHGDRVKRLGRVNCILPFWIH